MTNEQPQVHRALATAGVAVTTLSLLTAFDGGEATLRQSVHRRGAAAAVPLARDRRAATRQRRAVPGARSARRRSCRGRDHARSSALAMRLRRGRSFTPFTAVIATRASSTACRAARAYRRDSPAACRCLPLLYDEGIRDGAHHDRGEHPTAPLDGLEQTLPSSWYYSEETLHAGKGADLLPRMVLRRARGGAAEARRPGCWMCVGESILIVRNRPASCAASTTYAGIEALSCAAR